MKLLKQPFFIIGNPRSGTSLFRLMLNANRNITVPPECGFALWFAQKYYKSEYNSVLYSQFAHDVYMSKKFETWGIDEAFLLNHINNCSPSNYTELVCSVYSAYANNKNKAPVVVGDKNNYYINEFDKLKYYFPNSKIIFIIRDGRDVACSYKKLIESNIDSKYKPSLPVKIDDIAEEWLKNADLIHANRNNNAIVTRYEDILGNTAEELMKICEFLEVDYDANMEEYYKYNDEPKEFLQWKEKTLQKPDLSNINKFSSELSEEEIIAFNNKATMQLKRFKYMDK